MIKICIHLKCSVSHRLCLGQVKGPLSCTVAGDISSSPTLHPLQVFHIAAGSGQSGSPDHRGKAEEGLISPECGTSKPLGNVGAWVSWLAVIVNWEL